MKSRWYKISVSCVKFTMLGQKQVIVRELSFLIGYKSRSFEIKAILGDMCDIHESLDEDHNWEYIEDSETFVDPFRSIYIINEFLLYCIGAKY